MFKIIKDGVTLGMADKLNYIRYHENGCFILCDKDEAEGIAYNGVPYHLINASQLIGVSEDVTVEEVEAAVEIQKVNDTNSISFVTLAEAGSIDDVTASEHLENFAEWAYPISYKTGQLRRFKGKLYRCISDHTSQEDWTPDVSVSLWVSCSDPADEWPSWSQPVGAHDAYAKDSKVSHNDKHWVSDVDNNVWEPGVYGWHEFTEEE